MSEVKKYEVRLNGAEGSVMVEAASPEEACQKAKEETKSQRDVRNFRATLVQEGKTLSAPVPKLDKPKK